MTIEPTLCPDCGSAMISRTGKYGTFWGCKSYPKCRGTRDSMGRSKAERDAESEDKPYNDNEESAIDRIAENDRFRFRKS